MIFHAYHNFNKVANQTENPENFVEWWNALESYECRECGYDFADTTIKKGHLGLIKFDQKNSEM